MNRLLSSIFAVSVLAAVASQAAPFTRDELAAVKALQRVALESDDAYELVESLTREVGPRPAGSAGDRAAIAWAVEKLPGLGFQNVTTQPVSVPQWQRGAAELTLLSKNSQRLPVVALGGSIGTPDEGFDAEVLMVDGIEQLRALPREQVQGRIVFINARTERSRDTSSYGVTSDGRRGGASTAGALGAAAVLIRSIGTGPDRFPHTGSMAYAAGVPAIPAVAIANPDADLLERQLALGAPVRLRLRVTARELPPAQSANVIADIPGTDLAAEIVLLGAHLDSWDLGTGALDDGAGVAIVVAAARLAGHATPRPRRTLRVVLFANEEFGLSGAKAYAAQPPEILDRHVLAMGADLGAGPVWQLESHVDGGSLAVVREMARLLRPLGVEAGGNTATSIPDLQPLQRLGVPVLAPALDATNYFDVHHTANDVLSQVDAEALRQSVAVYATAAYLAGRTATRWRGVP